jgi:hypothetical protein
MASIYRPSYTRTDPKTGKIIRSKLKKWYVKYRDADGIIQRVPGFTNKEATRALAVELERKAARLASGLADPTEDQRKRPLADHLAEWHTDLIGRGNTAKHADLSSQRARCIVAIHRGGKVAEIAPVGNGGGPHASGSRPGPAS